MRFKSLVATACIALFAAGCTSPDSSVDKSAPGDSNEGATGSSYNDVAYGTTGTFDGEDAEGNSSTWSVKLDDIECGFTMTVPADAWTDAYGEEGDEVKADAGEQFCKVAVELKNTSKSPQETAPRPGNVVVERGEVAPEGEDARVLWSEFYNNEDDAPGFLMDDPVQPDESTKAFALYILRDTESIQSVVFSDESPWLNLVAK